MKKTITILMILMMSLTLVACTKQTTNDTRKDLVVGLEAAYAPFNWTVTSISDYAYPISNQPGSHVDGYDVQMSKELARILDRNLIIKAIEWDGLIPALNSGEIDVIIAGMSPTSERKLQINFSDEYYRSEIVMVVKRNTVYENATRLVDFSGSKVVAQRGTLYDDLIPQIDNVVHQTPLDAYSNLVASVITNVSDAFVAELPVAESVVKSNPSLTIVKFEEGYGFQSEEADITVSVGMRKSDTDLLIEINSALAQISVETRNQMMTEAVIRNNESELNLFGLISKYISLFVQGVGVTLLLAITGTLGGFILSLVLVAGKTQKIDKKRDGVVKKIFKRIANGLTTTYIVLFRGTPMIVQAMIFYYGVKLITDLSWWTPLSAGLIIVTLNTSAYIAEILRGSVNAIDKGQMEAARSLGFSRVKSLLYIVYPQAIKNALPAIGNEFIVNLKDTAVLSVIGVLDLFNATHQVVGATYDTVTPFIITAIIYLFLTGVTSIAVNYLENHQAGKELKHA
ncbi:transporter substrate-binding domain-containing protein [Acholeplasma laidlawii]|uniref:transporter substrate-binding domain-containing protein n=1 Tax=Acholeplasma laidlawii TaxID=2148 RepID=UPI00084C5B8B|nr:transporter substrate-binding domain-containing protein [Acholeplasma laidlawii]OED59002.1 hypothetical protein BHS12_05475 [Acholeplasma laidlawii]